jgi:hypothetical protein
MTYRQHFILKEDLNARVGKNRDEAGRFGENTINDSGDKHINLYKPYDMKICHTLFEHKNIQIYMGKIFTKSEIYY